MSRAGKVTWLLSGYVVLLSVLVLGAALRPGYALSYDMVFTPRESLLPWSVGLGAGLPRSVPQDAVVAVLGFVVPGWLLQKAALLAALLLAGIGAARLVAGPGRWVAATLAIWTPFVAERLLMGHWSLLIAYGCLPWAIGALRARHWARVVLWCALAALTPTGGLLLAVVCIPVVLATAERVRDRVLWTLAIGAVNVPWLLPSLMHGQLASQQTSAFALRPEGPWGAVLTALSTGGIWNAEVVPASRSGWWAPIVAAAVIALAVVGWRRTAARLGRPIAVTWLAATGAGLLVAVLSAVAPDAFTALIGLPGGGLARDAQKLLAPGTVLLAVLAGAGVSAWLDRIKDRAVAAVVLVAVVAVPIASMPDLTWGGLGRLQSVAYPEDFEAVRGIVARGSGDVVSLPWSAFRDFPWNDRRTVLDPMPRYLTATVITDDVLMVRDHGAIVPVGGDDPRAESVGARLEAGEPLTTFAPGMGIEFAAVAHDVAAQVPPSLLEGAEELFTGSSLRLYRLGDPTPRPAPGGLAAVIAADLAVVLGLLVLLATSTRMARRRTREVLPSGQPVEEV